jgi:alpha-D-ribose 1-methylphosphonate 5-triphosphate diphosphatase
VSEDGSFPVDGSPGAPALLLEGAEVVLDDRITRASVRIEGGVISGIDVARDGARAVDVSGLVLGPAFVDIHGDAFERQLMPRPGVPVPVEVALLDTDRQLAANGIATAYHALTLSWEPGLRSLDTAAEVLRALDRLRPRLAVEHRVQLRWETFSFEALPLIEAALAGALTPALAFNDHTTTTLRHPSVPVQDRPFDHAPDYPVADLEAPSLAAKVEASAKRAGLAAADYADRLLATWERRPAVPDAITRVAAKARAAGAPMLSHDDTQTETRRFYRALGAVVAEFPMHERLIPEARAAGDLIAFGAPNAMRGGSHLGSPGAGEMVARGWCDVLASDYFYPAMLGALARLAADGIRPLHALWPLVSGGPAAAMRLADRGRIAAGLRADLVLLDWPERGTPAVRACWRGGRAALTTRPVAEDGARGSGRDVRAEGPRTTGSRPDFQGNP